MMLKRSLRAVLAVLVVGCVAWTSAYAGTIRKPSRRVGPGGPVAHPAALRSVSDCDQLRGYYSEVVLETLIKSRYWIVWYDLPWSTPGGDAEVGSGGPSDFTSTNNQEEGVDELDIVKTDGNYIYATEDRSFHVVDSWPPQASQLLASEDVGGPARGLFLRDDLTAVFSSFYRDDGGGFVPRSWTGTRISLFDVTNRQAPRLIRVIEVEGDLVGARMIDGHLYAVVWSYLDVPQAAWELLWRDDLGLPEVDWNATDEEREAAADEAREILRPLVDDLVAALEIEEIVPMMRDRSLVDPFADARALLACEQLLLPAERSTYSVLSVLHVDLDEPLQSPVQAAGILSDGWTVYASSRSLYVAQTSWWSWWGWGDLDMKTAIHRFQLDPDGEEPVQYAATGEVEGWLLDQFSMSEFDGYLRVATTAIDWWWGFGGDDVDQGSMVTVLEDKGDAQLVEVGKVAGIAPGERIYASRFMGVKGYMVTFVQVDPLFTLDLSDPTDPRVIGEAELPGYSGYLHPVGDDHLLAVGMAGDASGNLTGLAVNLFDISDFANPTLAHQYTIESGDGSWSWSEALDDHHAFTFHRGVLSIPAYMGSWWDRFAGLIVMSVDVDDGIEDFGRVDHGDLAVPHLLPMIRRSVYIEDNLYSLSSRGIKVNRLYDPAIELAVVPFPLFDPWSPWP